MKILQQTIVNIDLDKCKKRVEKAGYTKAERKRLYTLFDMFEQGKWDECIQFINSWGRTKKEYPEREHVDTEIYDALWNYHVGALHTMKVLKPRCPICKQIDCCTC